jgi:hypothetical protein
VSGEPETRNARENTRRRRASSKHARLGCRYAPRPGCRAWGSGTIPSPATTRRSKLDFAARALHPTQVRTGFFPVSGGSASAVIAFLVYSVAKAGAPSEVRVRGMPTYAPADSAVFASGVDGRCGGAEGRSAGSPSERMSIRQPVSRAASRAFCPSLPIASESW